MENFKSVDEILDFAIAGEEEAIQFYNTMAGKMEKAWMADLFKDLAREEVGHRNKLMSVKDGKSLMPAESKIQDLKIADYVADVQETADMSYQDALVLAMKREKAAFKLYTDLANASETDEMKQTFLALAQEEAKHKLKIELEYDDNVLTDN